VCDVGKKIECASLWWWKSDSWDFEVPGFQQEATFNKSFGVKTACLHAGSGAFWRIPVYVQFSLKIGHILDFTKNHNATSVVVELPELKN